MTTTDEQLLIEMLQNSVQYTRDELERISNEYYEDDLDEQIDSYKASLKEQESLLERIEQQGIKIENLHPQAKVSKVALAAMLRDLLPQQGYVLPADLFNEALKALPNLTLAQFQAAVDYLFGEGHLVRSSKGYRRF